jgi:murein DD-endopeptidase MepM/ murein hydrolase activator NlpD
VLRLRAALAVLAVVLFSVALANPAYAANGRTRSPFADNQGWYVCRGYNSQSHTGNSAFALDLIADRPATVGPKGCTSNNVRASNGQAVYSPVPGRTSACWGSSGVNGQFVCVQSTLATSQGLIFIIGHLVPGSRVLNQNVTAGQRIGTVAAPDNLNGGISHIHIEVRPNAGSRSIRQIQPVEAFESTSSVNNSEGFFQL